MTALFSGLLATIVTIPFLGFAIIYFVSTKMIEDKKRSIKLAADGSTIIFIISVHFIVHEIWQQSYLWLILIVILVTAIAMAFLQRSLYEDIHVLKLVKGIWRVNFLLFVLVYILLFTYGLTTRIISSFA
jgi:hypothetical protein